MLGKILSLVVREEAVLLRIVHREIRSEIKARFFPIDLHFLLRYRRFEAVGRAFVVRSEYNRVSPFKVQSQFVVSVGYSSELLPYDRLHNLVNRTRLRIQHLWLDAKLFVLYVESEDAILEHSAALEDE